MRLAWLLILMWSVVPLWAQSGAQLDIDLDQTIGIENQIRVKFNPKLVPAQFKDRVGDGVDRGLLRGFGDTKGAKIF